MPSVDDYLLSTYYVPYVPEAGDGAVSVTDKRKQSNKIKENIEEVPWHRKEHEQMS